MDRFLTILVAGVLGYFAGAGLWQLQSAQAQSHATWQQLPATPGRVVEITPAGEPPFYITTAAGSTYTYADWRGQGWVPWDTANAWNGPIDVVRPCDQSSGPFRFAVVQPEDIADCFRELNLYADGYIEFFVILDREGRIWQAQNSGTPSDYFDGVCFSILGALLGAVIAFAATSGPGHSPSPAGPNPPDAEIQY